MLQISSSKLATKAPKLAIQINSTILQSQQMPRTPAFSRKRYYLPREKGQQSLKSSQEKSVQKSLKYTKIIPRDWKTDVSEVQSEVHIVTLLSEDSRETVVKRSRSRSHQKQIFLYPQTKSPKPKSLGRKIFQQFAAMNDSSKKSKINHKNDEHYIYWKNKAYEYLENNIKLMEQVRKLTRQNQELKSSIAELQQSVRVKAHSQENKIYTQKTLNIELRNMSTIYINKIQSMEKELKQKDILITTYYLKLKDLNARIAGDNQRIKLIQILREDVQRLKAENEHNKIESQKLEHNYYASTSTLLPQINYR